MGLLKKLFGSRETGQAPRRSSVDEVYISKEDLPEGKVRCPRCSAVLDTEADKIPTPKSADREQAAIAAMMASVGMQKVKLRCRNCRTEMDMIG